MGGIPHSSLESIDLIEANVSFGLTRGNSVALTDFTDEEDWNAVAAYLTSKGYKVRTETRIPGRGLSADSGSRSYIIYVSRREE